MTDLDAIRARHRKTDYPDGLGGTLQMCVLCGDWPCTVWQALALLDAERAEVARLRETLDAQEWTLYGRESERARIRDAVRGLDYGRVDGGDIDGTEGGMFVDDSEWTEVLDRAAVLAVIEGAEK